MELRLAESSEAQKAYSFIEDAKQYLKGLNIDQWQQGYPDLASVEKDIEKKEGYLFVEEGEIVGYTCISFGGEPCYENIKGAWKTDGPFAVVHRLAMSGAKRGKGFSGAVFGLVEEACRKQGIHSIRLDTDSENKTMRHVVEKNGYEYCGTIWFDYSDKVAYEKRI